MQVQTEQGWEDIGKIYVDLHTIASDLQPIQISAQLEKCVVSGVFIDFVISPKLLDVEEIDDENSLLSVSEISEVSARSQLNEKSMSFAKRLANSFRRDTGSGRNDNSTEPVSPQTHMKMANGSMVEETAINCDLSTSNTGRNGADKGARQGMQNEKMDISEDNGSNMDAIELDEKVSENDEISMSASELRSELRSLREEYQKSCDEIKSLKEVNGEVMRNLDKEHKKFIETQEKLMVLDHQLKRKDTEIKAVLNFQKKLESRMSAFVEKEKQLAIKEKELEDRGLKSMPHASESIEEKYPHGFDFDGVIHKLQQREGEIVILKTKVEKLACDKAKAEADRDELLNLHKIEKSDSDDNSRPKNYLLNEKKKPSFRTTILCEGDTGMDSSSDIKSFFEIWKDFQAALKARTNAQSYMILVVVILAVLAILISQNIHYLW